MKKQLRATRESVPDDMPLNFPMRLYILLLNAEQNGVSDIISWHPSGTKFLLYNVEKFVANILPNAFQQTKYSSFRRQLNSYGFQRVPCPKYDSTTGIDLSNVMAFSHEFFRRGDPQCCKNITRWQAEKKQKKKISSVPKIGNEGREMNQSPSVGSLPWDFDEKDQSLPDLFNDSLSLANGNDSFQCGSSQGNDLSIIRPATFVTAESKKNEKNSYGGCGLIPTRSTFNVNQTVNLQKFVDVAQHGPMPLEKGSLHDKINSSLVPRDNQRFKTQPLLQVDLSGDKVLDEMVDTIQLDDGTPCNECSKNDTIDWDPIEESLVHIPNCSL